MGEHRGKDDLEIIDACLDAFEASNRFVLLDNGQYGTRLELPIGSSASSFLELELFQAATLCKPITLITVGQAAMTSSPLARFMRQVAQDEPDIRPARDLVHAETLILEAIFGSGSAASIDALGRNRAVQALATERHKDWKNERLFEEPILLKGMTAGDVDGQRDAEVAAWYLDRADEQTGMNYMLSRTWIAMRAMMLEHYSTTTDPKFVALWDRALANWSRAAAWRGLHGHLFLGSLAASGARAAMNQRLGLSQFVRADEGARDLYDALGSANYSIAGLLPRAMGRAFYERCAAYVRAGLEARGDDERESLLPLRGAVELRLGLRSEARQTPRDALRLADHGGDPNHIGFLTSELGWSELRRNPWLARRHIAEGLGMLTSDCNRGFRCRMMRKLVYANIASFRWGEARVVAASLIAEATEAQAYDQIDQVIRFAAAGKP
ncbi:hypothetical protein [Citreimonas salinaria]|uniref:hypothetical protein n=1 Tax=Citreimonas salinaria TaxID=321339 RepID=UPI000B7D8EC1|nr:hypothetical protein [Citreimonas salinaria]